MPKFPRIQLKEPTTNWISEDDKERILENVEHLVYRTIYLFMMKQGCRPNEARALQWEKVDLKNDLVVIDAAFDLNVYRPFTKEKDARILPLHPKVREALLKMPRHLSGLVFVNRHGRPLSHSQINYHWRKAAEKVGIKITCYEGTRHSLASQAINRGVSERIVGDMLGHKTLTSTRRYAKMKADTLKQVWGEINTEAAPQPTRPQPAPNGKVVNITNWKYKGK